MSKVIFGFLILMFCIVFLLLFCIIVLTLALVAFAGNSKKRKRLQPEIHKP